jgi:hypothetical protein
MDRNTLRKIFDFIEEKENKTSLAYKILNDFDNIRDNELIVNGNLKLSNKNITSLPEGLQVEGSLYLSRCTSLTSLPVRLQVGGSLGLSRCTSLTSLPDGLQVGGDLSLSRCINLTSLPEGLQVEGDLYLTGCTNLTSLPEGLQVGGDLFVANTPLAKYTDGDVFLEMIGSNGYIKGIIKRSWRG